jgi:hypothetical protein
VITRESPAYLYVEEFIKLEVRLGIQFMNEDNNGSIMNNFPNKRDAKPWMKGYCSSSWVVVRNAWLYDYLHVLFHTIVYKREMSFSEVAQSSYEKTLGTHHNWFLK